VSIIHTVRESADTVAPLPSGDYDGSSLVDAYSRAFKLAHETPKPSKLTLRARLRAALTRRTAARDRVA
jgi:hypothetical protein